ncbi:hypothetical protein WJ95_09395 [Burkholderia ubonensis]|uniref:hypothetical protein n=1 Tax=Burkholderia ubonensis TaxID=101571 RepID=UPI00075C9C96|nr:hypothetical protein [Burkholderia ubonensis]KVP90711.1 hypothetical protein WJ95_09395 [Burkholderia ubonensis]
MGWTTVAPWRPIAGSGQNITIGASSTQATNPVGDNAQAVQLSAIGGNCHVAISKNPTAGAADMLIKASDPPLVVRVEPGEKIAAIQDGASTGTLNVIEVTH